MQNLIPRNNTSFIKSLEVAIKSIIIDKNDPLKYHQRIVHEYLLNYPHIRGILAYQEMGSGKTILAASIIDTVLKKKLFKNVVFISSKTLHANFINDYKKYIKMINPLLDEIEIENILISNCKFITLTANNMLQQINDALADPFLEKSKNLDDTFLVIDEAHNFFNGITNGSKNYIGLYELIMDAKNIKLLFLTGSPITNDPFEMAVCFNMLNGYFTISDHNKTKKLTLFGEHYTDFSRYFVSHPDTLNIDGNSSSIPIINNKEKFSNRIIGLVSYYGTDSIKNLLPKLEEIIVQIVPMSAEQYTDYVATRDKEQEETQKSFSTNIIPLQKPQGSSSSYRVRSRQSSNFVYPKYASNIYRDENGNLKIEKHLEKLKSESFDIDQLIMLSPKFVQLLVNISIHLPDNMLTDFKKLKNDKRWMPELIKKKSKIGIGPGIIYSQFIDSGIGLIAKILEHYKMKELTDLVSIDNNPNGSFAIISGDTSPELRTELIKLSTSDNNKKGEILSLLLITATGAEGISTKYMRHVHAVEPFWHWARLSQVFARAARLGSHIGLPEEDRTVQPYIYLSDYPISSDKQKEETTDITLYHKAIQNQILIDSFLQTLKESSIDCMIHYSSTDKNIINCRKCSPTNEKLFINDINVDIKILSPCKPLVEEKIKAKSIIINDMHGKREYMYYIDEKKNLHILSFNKDINAYQEIFPDHPDYFNLSEKILEN